MVPSWRAVTLHSAHPEPRRVKRQEKRKRRTPPTLHSPGPTPATREPPAEGPGYLNRPHTSIREASIADAPTPRTSRLWICDADPRGRVGYLPPGVMLVGATPPRCRHGAQGEGVYLLQLTSSDHTREAAGGRRGRYWFNKSEQKLKGRPPRRFARPRCGSRPPTAVAKVRFFPR